MADRVSYRDIVPYEVPSSLDALRGPATGTLELPVTVHWGPQHVYDLARPDQTVSRINRSSAKAPPLIRRRRSAAISSCMCGRS